MNLQEWDLAQAQRQFETLPQELQLVSLSPRFAAADATRQDALQARFLGFRQDGQLWLNSIHVRPLPGSNGALGAISPYGYGGPLSNSLDSGFLRAAWEAYTRWCREHSVLAEFCRFHPQAANHRFSGAEASENRQTVSVDLRAEELQSQYSALARRKLKRAQASGARARFSRDAGDWRRFAGFYRDAMQAAGAAGWYLFGDGYFQAMSELPEAWLCICEAGDTWWSAGLYLFGREVIEYHLGASAPQGHEAGTPTLMQHEAAQQGRAAGAHSLYLGGGTDTRGDNPLLFHKLSFSRRQLPFFIGQTIHDEQTYWAVAERAGHDRANPPARILLD